MGQVSRYLTRQLLVAMTIVTVVMTSIIWLFISVRAVESIINRGLSLKLFVMITWLQLPNFIVQILPIALFISVLFVYNRLNADREILVMRAAGLSPLALAKPVIGLGLGAAAIAYAFALYVTPLSYQMFRDLQWDVRYSFTNILLREGMFNNLSDSLTIYIRERTGSDELNGILIHDNRDPEKKSTLIAERGAIVDTPTGARVLMFEGNRQELNRKTGKLAILYFERYSFDLQGVSERPDIRYREPRERAIDELIGFAPEDAGNPNDYGRFIVELHQRLASPLAALGFGLIAFLFLMFGEYSRRGQVLRVINAAGAFVVLQVGYLGLNSLAAKKLALVPLIYAIILVPIVVALAIIIYNPRLKLPILPRRATSDGSI